MEKTIRNETYLQSFNLAFNNIGKHRKTGSLSDLFKWFDRNDQDIQYIHSPRPSIDPLKGFSCVVEPSLSYIQFQGRLLRDVAIMTEIPVLILTDPYTSEWKMGWFERMTEEVEC